MKLYVPPKVLAGEATNETVSLDPWPYDNGTGDPFWMGSQNPKPYRWRIVVNITEQTHSSHLTRLQGAYNGIDVSVGDWVADRATGTAVRIIGIDAKTETRVVLTVEDVYRYNTFRSPTGKGIFQTPAMVIIFELNQDHIPVIDPVPSGGVGPTFTANLFSRFQNFTGENNVLIEQEGHGLVTGDIVAVDPVNNKFVKASSQYRNIIGRISTEGPGPNHFIFDPITTVLTFDRLEGQVGDILYSKLDGDGITLENTGIPVYIKLQDYTKTSTRGTNSGGTTPGNIIIVNGVEVTIGGTGSVQDVADAINATTDQHQVTATAELGENQVSNTESHSYGEPAAFVSNGPQISINGQVVTFTSSVVGEETYPGNPGLALEEDFAVDINNAGIPNIVAVGEDNKLTIINTSGGDIVLANVKNDANGTPMLSPSQGTSSATGIVEGLYVATTERFLRIEGPDAGEVTLANSTANGTNNVLDDLGIYTVENGQKARALYVANGVHKGESYTVDTDAQRLALSPWTGDTVFVKDSGNGEWAYWVYAEDKWELIATQDSARTDADTLSMTFNYNDTGELYIGTVSDGSRVSNVTVEVITPVDDINATLNVGDSEDNARLMSDAIIDLTQAGTYTFTPSHVYSTGSDVDLNAYFDPASSTQGQIKVVISYA